MRTLALIASLLVASCYQPKLPSGQFRCDSDGDCPSHQICGGGLCVDPDGADLSGRSGDLAGADLRTADPSDPCKNGWIDIAPPTVYACRRPFNISNGDFSGLCRTGFHVCNATDDLTGAAAVMGTLCTQAGRFFATQIDIALENTRTSPRQADGVCMPQGTQMDRALLGCGSDQDLYELNNSGCSGLRKAMRCSRDISGWRCTSVRDVNYTGTQSGLLCCADR